MLVKSHWDLPIKYDRDRFCQLQATPIEVSPCCSSQVREAGDASGCTHTFFLTYQLLSHWLLHLYHKHLHNLFPLTRTNYKESDLGGEVHLDHPNTVILLQACYALTTKFLSTCNCEQIPKAKNTICVQILSTSLCLAIFLLFSHI